mgnify:CR=1 FL=1
MEKNVHRSTMLEAFYVISNDDTIYRFSITMYPKSTNIKIIPSLSLDHIL